MWQWRRSRVAVRNLDLFITARTIHRTPCASVFNGKMLTAARATETNVCTRIDWLDYGRRQSTFGDSSYQPTDTMSLMLTTLLSIEPVKTSLLVVSVSVPESSCFKP